MENNKEVKIAIIVGIIMITIGLIIFMISKSENTVNELDLKVYRNFTVKDGREYRECTLTTDDIIEIRREYRKITKLDESSKLTGQSITGVYMVKDGENYIAFDADESNKVYVKANGKEAIYKVESTIYEKVYNLCNNN